MATLEQLTQEIAETTALFNKLRDEKNDPALLDETKKRLGRAEEEPGGVEECRVGREGSEEEGAAVAQNRQSTVPQACLTSFSFDRC